MQIDGICKVFFAKKGEELDVLSFFGQFTAVYKRAKHAVLDKDGSIVVPNGLGIILFNIVIIYILI